MRCSLCTAVHDAERKEFIVSYGPAMSEEKFNSRCCHYAKARGRQGCINPSSTIDPAETMEGRLKSFESKLHPEMKELFMSAMKG